MAFRMMRQQWFKPKPGNVVGAVPPTIVVLAAVMEQARALHPENPFPEGDWQHDLFALDQFWLYGPVRVQALAELTGLTPKRVETVLGRLRRSGIIESYRPPGWQVRWGMRYIVHLPSENAVLRLSPSQVRAKLREKDRQALKASLEVDRAGGPALSPPDGADLV